MRLSLFPVRTRRSPPGAADDVRLGRLQDALIAASFWALDLEERRLGLDGSDWLFEARLKEICQQMEPRRRAWPFTTSAGCFSNCRATVGGNEDLLIRLDWFGGKSAAGLEPTVLFGRF